MADFLIPEEPGASSFERFYRDIQASPNNFSFWFPKVAECGIAVPRSVVVPVPQDVVMSFFMEREGDGQRVDGFVHNTLFPAIPEDFGERVFLKNGCFSDKFRFSLCSPLRTEEAIRRSLLGINVDSFCFDTGGNAEVVVRELVGTEDGTFRETIYDGMRLRPEIRVFHDFDSGRSLYAANYWNWGYCNEAICRNEEDAQVYRRLCPIIEGVFWEQKNYVLKLVERSMKGVGLRGVWSVDLMYAEGRWWLIDMALGHMSAYWDEEKAKAALGTREKDN